MSSRRPARQMIVAVMLGVLVGGGLMAITPAGAQVNQALETNWKKIWKKELKPLANKSYYKKSETDAKYASKAEAAAAAAAAQNAANSATDGKLGSYYKKTESDAKYAPAGSSYTKAESDAKYAPAPKLIRGTFQLGGQAASSSDNFRTGISFGTTFSAPPTVHYINDGAATPAGCLGNAANPDAEPGNLCVFENGSGNLSTRGICSGVANTCGAADRFGAGIYVYAAAAGSSFALGTWAARPIATVSPALTSPNPAKVGPSGCDAASGSC
ncbi:hypothetical protein SAMN04489844_0469 [Nocardioides exalbidus]|uniref:Uncharacterized protein n=1 Tax=Nocardioides exalbidus TaxID=402596 RepID=A0A1H4K7A9_9ACTN|nr:hypothetical protein [Nocardioides exalbidus]SEB54411.1 hypothetical protein SAMN04489844_0469 [Nocardioides exalbidus]